MSMALIELRKWFLDFVVFEETRWTDRFGLAPVRRLSELADKPLPSITVYLNSKLWRIYNDALLNDVAIHIGDVVGSDGAARVSLSMENVGKLLFTYFGGPLSWDMTEFDIWLVPDLMAQVNGVLHDLDRVVENPPPLRLSGGRQFGTNFVYIIEAGGETRGLLALHLAKQQLAVIEYAFETRGPEEPDAETWLMMVLQSSARLKEQELRALQQKYDNGIPMSKEHWPSGLAVVQIFAPQKRFVNIRS